MDRWIAVSVYLRPCDGDEKPETFHTIPLWIDEDREWTWGYWDGKNWCESVDEVEIELAPTYWIALPIPPTAS